MSKIYKELPQLNNDKKTGKSMKKQAKELGVIFDVFLSHASQSIHLEILPLPSKCIENQTISLYLHWSQTLSSLVLVTVIASSWSPHSCLFHSILNTTARVIFSNGKTDRSHIFLFLVYNFLQLMHILYELTQKGYVGCKLLKYLLA